MLGRQITNLIGVLVISGLIGVSLVDTAYAQQPNTRRLQVTEVIVKGGRLNDFIDLRQQLADAARGKDLRRTDVWQVMQGNTNMFHVVRRYDSFAEMDEPFEAPMEDQKWGQWIARIQDTVHSRRVITLHDHYEMAIPAAEGSPLNMIQLVKNTVKAGAGVDYGDWLRESYIPALKDSGHQGVSIAHELYGGSIWTWYLVRRIDSLGELDAPPLSHMDLADRRRLMRNGYEMTTANEGMILRYREDLSY